MDLNQPPVNGGSDEERQQNSTMEAFMSQATKRGPKKTVEKDEKFHD